MSKLFYCMDCKSIFEQSENCPKCGKEYVKELEKGTSVSVRGQKQKGKVFKISSNKVQVIIITENKERLIREYNPGELVKIL